MWLLLFSLCFLHIGYLLYFAGRSLPTAHSTHHWTRCTLLYLSDSHYGRLYSNHRIQVFDTNLKFIFAFGNFGSGDGEMRHPENLTIDPIGNVYVAESHNHRIQVVSQNGTHLRTFGMRGSGPGELSSPMGIHVDHDYVYVAEWLNNRISVFHTSGAFITSFGRPGSGEGELNYPRGITIDQDGFLYICDISRIQIFWMVICSYLAYWCCLP